MKKPTTAKKPATATAVKKKTPAAVNAQKLARVKKAQAAVKKADAAYSKAGDVSRKADKELADAIAAL